MKTINQSIKALSCVFAFSLVTACSPLVQLGTEMDAVPANEVALEQSDSAGIAKSNTNLFINDYDSTTLQNARMAGMKRAGYKTEPMVTINHYVQSLMHDLAANLEVINTNFNLGVTSFVYLDGDYQQSDLLGNQLSEAFMHEANQFGMAVTDFKTTDYIRVTPTGDFTFSRDFLELTKEYPLSVVLGGTLVRHQNGVLVNARMVNISDKKVIASAQVLVPQNVVQSLKGTSSAPLLQLKGAGTP